MKRFKRVAVALSLITVAFFLLNNGANAYALDGKALTTKVLLRGLEKCYEDYYIPSGKIIDGSTSQPEVDDIMSDKGNDPEEDTIKVFSKRIGNNLDQEIPAVSCKQVFEGWSGPKGGNIDGLSKLTGKTFDISKVGFKVTESVAKKWGCIRFPFSYTYNSAVYGSKKNLSSGICFMLDEDGNVIKDKYGLIHDDELLPEESQGALEVFASYDNAYNISIDSNFPVTSFVISIGCSSAFSSETVSFNGISECVMNSFNGDSKELSTSLKNDSGSDVIVTIEGAEVSYPDNTASGGLGQQWTKDGSGAAMKALEYYGGLNNFDDITFSEAEKYAVLQEYVSIVMDSDDNMGLDLESCYDSLEGLGSDYGVLNAGKWCKINGWEGHKDEKFNVIKNVIKTDKQALKTVTFEEVLKRIKEIDESQISSNTGLSIGVEEEKETVCYANSGALGWILCPVIEGVSRVGTAMWEFVENNFLQIRAGDLFQSGGGTQQIWEKFRDIANVIFIILFLAVIFSQLTGVGIDNYGIKKILPRLIVVAILVNLSFLICALAVDVSNILGYGLNSMFSSMAGEMPSSITSLAPTEASGGSILAVVGIGLGGAVLFGLLHPVGALTLGGMVLGVGLAVLGIVLSIVFSILFMFIILIIRNAGVVILIAISPVAIVCYMLPNTEGLFKKWLNMLKALLVVYPICGALIGAGRLAGNLLASVPDSPGMAVAGMVVNVLPFFLVPMLLKQSLRMMGNIGARLSSAGKNMGRRTSSFAQNKITGSEAVKNWSQLAQERRNGARAARISERLRRKSGGDLSKLSAYERQKLLKADNERNSWKQKEAQASAGTYLLDDEVAKSRAVSSRTSQELRAYDEQYSSLTRGEMGGELQKAVDAYKSDRSVENTTRLQAAITAAEGRGMNKEMLASLGDLDLKAGDGKGSDAKILSQLAGSKNKLINQFGRQMSKNNEESLSLNQFTEGSGSGNVSMSAAFRNQGSNVLNGMDDDTLEHISNHGAQVETGMLLNAAANTSNQKELTQINKMLASRSDFDGKISGQHLAGFSTSTLDELANNRSVTGGAVAAAYSDLAGNQQLASTVSGEKQGKMLAAMDDGDLRDVATNSSLGANNAMRMAAEKEYMRRTGLTIDHGSVGGGSGSTDSSSGNASSVGAGSASSNSGASGAGRGGASVSGVGDTYRSGDHTFTRQANGRWADENGNVMGGDFSARIEANPAAQQQIRENARKNEIYTNMSDDKIVELANSTPANSGQQSVGQGGIDNSTTTGTDSGVGSSTSTNTSTNTGVDTGVSSGASSATGTSVTRRTGPSEAVIRSAQREAERRGLQTHFTEPGTQAQGPSSNPAQAQRTQIRTQPRPIGPISSSNSLGSQATARPGRIITTGSISNISRVADSLGHNDSNAGRQNLNSRHINKN